MLNGRAHGTIKGKGVLNNQISSLILKIECCGCCDIERISDTELNKKVKITPLEVVLHVT